MAGQLGLEPRFVLNSDEPIIFFTDPNRDSAVEDPLPADPDEIVITFTLDSSGSPIGIYETLRRLATLAEPGIPWLKPGIRHWQVNLDLLRNRIAEACEGFNNGTEFGATWLRGTHSMSPEVHQSTHMRFHRTEPCSVVTFRLLRHEVQGTHYTVFISYCSKDIGFVQLLDRRLEVAGVETFRDKDDLRGGSDWREQIIAAIRGNDKVLLVCSEASLNSEDVAWETLVTTAYEDAENCSRLYAINLDGYVFSEAAQVLGITRVTQKRWSENWILRIRNLHIPDFTQWQDTLGFERALDKLLADLRRDAD